MVKNIYQLPTPTGKYRVGIKKFGFTDSTRSYLYGPEVGAPRKLAVTIWYPAENTERLETFNYFTKEELDTFKNSFPMKIVGLLINKKMYNIKTNSYYEAPIAQSRVGFPLLIFNHGGNSFAQQSQYQMEELASHGYIVTSVGFPYESAFASFPDGRVIPGEKDTEMYKEMVEYQKTKRFKEYIKATQDDNTPVEEIKRLTREMPSKVALIHEQMDHWVKDNSFILEKLKEMNNGNHEDKIFQNKIDFTHGAGIFGHSGGGNAATETCYANNQFSCGVNMDSWVWGKMYKSETPLNTPQMFLMTNLCWNSLQFFHNANLQDSYYLKIKNAHHFDLTDSTYYLRALRLLGKMGLSKMNPDLLRDIINNYLLAFFNKYLKNMESKYLEKQIYQEVDHDIRRKEN